MSLSLDILIANKKLILHTNIKKNMFNFLLLKFLVKMSKKCKHYKINYFIIFFSKTLQMKLILQKNYSILEFNNFCFSV
jgi:hypothetical protein